MFGVEGTDNLHFAVYAKQLGAGLDEQLEKFIREHPDTRLIIIDTLQKIREVSTDAYSYANDYDIVGRMVWSASATMGVYTSYICSSSTPSSFLRRAT